MIILGQQARLMWRLLEPLDSLAKTLKSELDIFNSLYMCIIFYDSDEMAVDQFGSGGGFYDSSVFSQQNAQYEVSDVLHQYLQRTFSIMIKCFCRWKNTWPIQASSSHQQAASTLKVQTIYYKQKYKRSSILNTQGRATPDVSALGEGFQV